MYSLLHRPYHQGLRAPTQRLDIPLHHSRDFLGNPFQTPFSTILFATLLGGLLGIVCILARKYYHVLTRKRPISCTTCLRRLDEARALALHEIIRCCDVDSVSSKERNAADLMTTPRRRHNQPGMESLNVLPILTDLEDDLASPTLDTSEARQEGERRSTRSRLVIMKSVLVGSVGESRLAQRRRTMSSEKTARYE